MPVEEPSLKDLLSFTLGLLVMAGMVAWAIMPLPWALKVVCREKNGQPPPVLGVGADRLWWVRKASAAALIVVYGLAFLVLALQWGSAALQWGGWSPQPL